MDAVHKSQLQLPGGAPDLHPAVDRATILAVIADVARANGLADHIAELERQCAAESQYNVAAHNVTSDCYGLFQLAAATAKEFVVNRYDWRDNIVGGVKYMAWLLRYFGGDYAKALAGFNWGPGNLRHHIAARGAKWRDGLPAETAGYLKKILV